MQEMKTPFRPVFCFILMIQAALVFFSAPLHASSATVLNELDRVVLVNAPLPAVTAGNNPVVSADGRLVVIGAPEDSEAAQMAGAAYVFERTGNKWVQQVKLLPPGAQIGDRFGVSVALSVTGDTLLVGAYLDDGAGPNAGAVFPYTRTGSAWLGHPPIFSPDGTDRFGVSVDVSADGNRAVIGAGADGNPATLDAGAVFVFERIDAAWTFRQRLDAPMGSPPAEFGTTVRISADARVIAVGAPLGLSPGRVYMFELDASAFALRMQLAGDAAAGLFGFALALSGNGDTLIAGAPAEFLPNNMVGAAYFFERETGAWTRRFKLVDPRGRVETPLGANAAISADGQTALLGLTSLVSPPGTAILLARGETAWSPMAELLASDGPSIEHFGNRVALSPDGRIPVVIGGTSVHETYGYLFQTGLRGDMNCDGLVTPADIAGFVLALTDPAAYAAQFFDCNVLHGDINGDGLVTPGDIAGFVEILIAP